MTFVDSPRLLSTLDFFTLDSRLFYSRLSIFLLSALDFLLTTLDSTLDPRLLDTLTIQLILQRDFATFREFHLQQPTSTCACIDSR